MSPTTPLRVALAGATGRTGSRVLAACEEASDIVCTSPLTSASASRLDEAFDVLIDFSVPEALGDWIAACKEHGAALVVGTTGHTEEQERLLRDAAGTLAIVLAPNMAVGMNLLLRAVSDLAHTLGPEFDVEIIDIHHHGKRDAPSGTARSLAERIQVERDPALPPPPISSLRMGGVAGEHAVHFSSPDETLSLSHRAHGRDVFARGALMAARWVRNRDPGLYGMQDVIACG